MSGTVRKIGPRIAGYCATYARRTRMDVAMRGRRERNHEDGKLHDDLAEVVRMLRPQHRRLFPIGRICAEAVFCASATLSIRKPIVHSMTLAMSQPVPKAGCVYWVKFGELIAVTGKLTIQTQII